MTLTKAQFHNLVENFYYETLTDEELETLITYREEQMKEKAKRAEAIVALKKPIDELLAKNGLRITDIYDFPVPKPEPAPKPKPKEAPYNFQDPNNSGIISKIKKHGMFPSEMEPADKEMYRVKPFFKKGNKYVIATVMTREQWDLPDPSPLKAGWLG